ncbi:MAG TPA: selenoneine synthase SenA [Verrucomicrobiae bacterium]|nr:selenoneine synthase SenA [Verrucomicrobiae bacterium]
MPTTIPASQLACMVTDAHERTIGLVQDLAETQLVVPQTETVNPFLWELGHTAFFYDVFLLPVLGSTKFLLEGAESFYDSFKIDHCDRWGLPLPSREATLDYKNRVLDSVLKRLASDQPGAEETYLYLLSVLHEDMHEEAFTYMRQTLEYPAPGLSIAENGSSAHGLGGGPWPGDVEIPGGVFQLGATPDLPFVFDNEKWAHPVDISPFRIARAPVTNAQFAEFVGDRGYLQRKLWSPQGWIWRTKTGAQRPIYWNRGQNGWLRRHFDQLVPLEAHAPVLHVNWYEADAYCHWAGRRLPTEAEWEMAASAEPAPGGTRITGHKRRYPWGDEPPTPEHANLDSRMLGCVDVGAYAAGDSAFGCRQMIGNIWEWTASPFFPFPGFTVDSPYREYSAPWFGYRKVLRGGAWATRSRLVRNSFRNFFLPDRRDVFAGFRTCAL